MKSQGELWAEYERLKAAELYDAAGKVLDLEPISDNEWLKILHTAPLDDEPVSADERRSLDELHAALGRIPDQRAG